VLLFSEDSVFGNKPSSSLLIDNVGPPSRTSKLALLPQTVPEQSLACDAVRYTICGHQDTLKRALTSRVHTSASSFELRSSLIKYHGSREWAIV
jgi:hypothetical protein